MALTAEQKKRAQGYFEKKDTSIGGSRQTVGDFINSTSKELQDLSKPSLSSSFFGNLKNSLKERGAGAAKTLGQAAEGKITPLEGGAQLLGQGIGAVGDLAGNVLGTAAKATGISDIAKDIGADILETDIGKQGLQLAKQGADAYESWKQANPRAADNLEAVVNIASVLPVGKGAQVGTGIVKQAAKQAAGKVDDVAKLAAKKIAPVGSALKTTKDFITSKAADISEAAKGAKERLPINIAEKKAQEAVLKSLPENGQKAARGGVLPRDIQVVVGAKPMEKNIFRKMVNAAKSYELDRSAPDPAQFVGKQLRSRFEKLDKARQKVGEKLGDFASKITTEELPTRLSVLGRLQEVPGLKGLKINNKGMLDFSETSMSGALTAPARKTINNAFKDVKGRSGTQIHKLRQELFEVLGGKKRANVVLNDTEEQALEAIRQGLADVLEKASPNYKKFNAEYAQIATPIKEMRKYFKNIAGADDDILDMKASILARRLSSNAASTPEIKGMIRAIEKELKKRGFKSGVDIERLQDFYNAVSRYYDVTKDTSLAGQISLGAGDMSASGLTMRALQEATKEMGVTPATMKKAFEGLLN